MAQAKSLKDRGNDAFRLNDLALALDLYTQAASEDPTDAASPNNAAAVHLKLKQFVEAKRCCDQALRRDPSNVKALVRRAQANAGLGEDGRSVRDYRSALRIQPHHATASAELDELVRARRRAAKQAAADPRLARWIASFRANLAAQQTGGRVSRREAAAEQAEVDRLNSDPATRRVRKAFMRNFETEIGIRGANDPDEGSESSGSEADDDESFDSDIGSDAEWESVTDEEMNGDDDMMDQDDPSKEGVAHTSSDGETMTSVRDASSASVVH